MSTTNCDLAACVADEETTRKLVGDAMREDRFVPLAWKDDALQEVQRVLASSRLTLGTFDTIRLTENNDGRVWCHADVADVAWGAYVAGTLEDAKLVAIHLLSEKVSRAAAIMKNLVG